VSVTATIYRGMRAPRAVRIDVTPSASTPDLTVVTAAEIEVRLFGSPHATWSATLSGQSATTLRLTHVFDALGAETERAGPYTLMAILTVPGGEDRVGPYLLDVKDY